MDAGNGGDALALVWRAVRCEHTGHSDPREVLTIARRPDHGADSLAREIEGCRRTQARKFRLPPVALQLGLRDDLATAARDVTDSGG